MRYASSSADDACQDNDAVAKQHFYQYNSNHNSYYEHNEYNYPNYSTSSIYY